jgi:hypothetical protein
MMSDNLSERRIGILQKTSYARVVLAVLVARKKGFANSAGTSSRSPPLKTLPFVHIELELVCPVADRSVFST